MERCFGVITRQRIRWDRFGRVPELIEALDDYIARNNEMSTPSIRTKAGKQIILQGSS